MVYNTMKIFHSTYYQRLNFHTDDTKLKPSSATILSPWSSVFRTKSLLLRDNAVEMIAIYNKN